jgi:hypothetical protein
VLLPSRSGAGTVSVVDQDREHVGIHRRFAELVRERACDGDLPLTRVANAFMPGRRSTAWLLEDCTCPDRTRRMGGT